MPIMKRAKTNPVTEAESLSLEESEPSAASKPRTPNVGGVILIDLGCKKTNLSYMEKYLTNRAKPIEKPFYRMGIQEADGTRAAIEQGLKYVKERLPEVNRLNRE